MRLLTRFTLMLLGGEYHRPGLSHCQECGSLICHSGQSPLLLRRRPLTSTLGYEGVQVCSWGLLDWGTSPLPLMRELSRQPGGRARWLSSLSRRPSPHPTCTHAGPRDMPHWELKPKDSSRRPGTLLGPNKALCYPLWSGLRLLCFGKAKPL